MSVRLRFAPSPNGALHLGHAFSALFAERMARDLDGTLLLRIEDIDATRCRPEFTAWVLEDLQWLGLSWPEPVRRQSAHLAAYTTALDRLDRLRLLYPCFCTRKKLKQSSLAKDPDGAPLYPGTCKLRTARERMQMMTAGTPYALRLDMAKAVVAAGGTMMFRELVNTADGEPGVLSADPREWGDVILARKDIGTSYHIAVVVDDAVQGITHVTRGTDLFKATAIHRLLQVLLDLREPQYAHHKLIGDETGRKLSKSAGDRSLRSLRQEGVTPAEIRELLGFERGR